MATTNPGRRLGLRLDCYVAPLRGNARVPVKIYERKALAAKG